MSMYSNIDLTCATTVMKLWMKTHVPTRGNTIPQSHIILDALDLVMHHNIMQMQFGDSYFLQMIGTAMGTSIAVVFANHYLCWHKKILLLAKYCGTLKRIFHLDW